MAKPEGLREAQILTCVTCGAEKFDYSMGDYDGSGRAFCLSRDGQGELCWRERPRGPLGVKPDPESDETAAVSGSEARGPSVGARASEEVRVETA